MKTIVTALICLLSLPRLKPFFLNALGHSVHPSARVGMNLIRVQTMKLGQNARIGHFNYIAIPALWMGRSANMRHMNRISGTFSMRMGAEAFTGSRNEVVSGRVLPGPIRQRRYLIAAHASMTTRTFVDLCDNVTLGSNTVLAGRGIQIWTHGFIHRSGGGVRELVKGSVRLGRNCYVGSMTCINFGVRIEDEITIGSMSSVAKSLNEPGVYVGASLRHIPSSPEERLQRLVPHEGPHGVAYYRS